MDAWKKWLMVLGMAVSIFKIFGSKGIILTIGIITLVLSLVFFFQNSLLYMPGKSLFIKTFQIQHIAQEIIHKAIAILPKRDWSLNRSVLQHQTMST